MAVNLPVERKQNMSLERGMSALTGKNSTLWKDTRGDAVVEATILFPIIIMIFAGLMLLAMYLPTRALLQHATQQAATAIATERSDTWLRYDPETLEYGWVQNKDELGSVYGALFGALTGNKRDDADNAAQIVINKENNGVFKPGGETTVQYGVVNYIIYKEIVVTATHTIPLPVDLSFVGLPAEIPVTVTSTAVVQNGDEFVRNLDLAMDVTEYLAEKFNLTEMFDSVGKVWDKFTGLLGI